MTILLVMPWDKGHKRYRAILSPFISYQPLTLPTLAALVPPELGARVEVCDEIGTPYTRFLRRSYDVVAVSFVSSESARAYEIAAVFRARGAYVVFGGYHMLYNSREGAAHADTVIVGPGELSWPQFLRDFAAGRPQPFYQLCPVPGSLLTRPRTGVLPRRKYVSYPTLLANPGCGNGCLFCAIKDMWANGGRDVDEVAAELKDRRGGIVVFFDPNFFGDRAYALSLMRAIAPLNRRWVGAACVSCAEDEELLYWARKSGCGGLLLGLESMTHGSLQGVGKGFNDPNRYRKAIGRLQSYGINVNGCFVLGLDSDTEESLLSLPAQVDYLGLDLARFSLLTPAPGSPLFHKLKAEGRILTENWADYDQDKVVFQPARLTPERLREVYFQVWRETYRWGAVLGRAKNARTRGIYERAAALAANVGFKFLGKEM